MLSECNLKLSFNPTPEMATTEFMPAAIDPMFYEAGRVLKMYGRYSNLIFKDNYRKSDNYIQDMTNCIILDIDEGITIAEFMSGADFAYALGTTKSHNKDKNGKVCERFRVIIPTKTAINLNSSDYSRLMSEVFEMFPMADQACKDTARAYSGYQNADVYTSEGELFDWEPVYKRYLKKIEILRRWQEKEKLKSPEREFTQDDTMKAMESRFRNIYTAGNRNNAVADIILWCKKEGMDYGLIENFVSNLVSESGDPLGDKELMQTFKYHFRR